MTCPLQAADVVLIRSHKDHLTIDGAVFTSIDDGLQIGAAPRDQCAYLYFATHKNFPCSCCLDPRRCVGNSIGKFHIGAIPKSWLSDQHHCVKIRV